VKGGRERGSLRKSNDFDWLFPRDPRDYAYFSLYLKMETDPVSETLCFLFI
jgi:hypothetical protein